MNSKGKLLYISGYRLDGRGGSSEHVREITSHLASLGWDATLVGATTDGTVANLRADLASRVRVIPLRNGESEGLVGALSFRSAVARLAHETRFDLAYVRPARKTLFAVWWLRRLGVPYFVEINTNVGGELRAVGARAANVALSEWISRYHLRGAHGAFCVTHELAQYARDQAPGIPKVWTTGNGFASEATSLAAFDETARTVVGVASDETVLTFLGSIQPWHGIDIAIETLSDLPQARLFVIGDGSERQRLEDLAHRLGVDARVHWFGHRQGEELQTLLSASDVAIGSLALSRNGMVEAQPLKVRHYLGVGLPTIIGYHDTLLSDESPGVFYAHTPEEIINAVQRIRSSGDTRSPEYRQRIRDYALRHLSWEAIARQTSDALSSWLSAVRSSK